MSGRLGNHTANTKTNMLTIRVSDTYDDFLNTFCRAENIILWVRQVHHNPELVEGLLPL